MGRFVIVLVFALGLSAFASQAADCPDAADPIEAVEVELALPVSVPAAIAPPASVRWRTQVSSTGREAVASIFRPPI